jgi:hypothetical protein
VKRARCRGEHHGKSGKRGQETGMTRIITWGTIWDPAIFVDDVTGSGLPVVR